MFQVKPPIDVNCPADTGNTPLHAAANNGNVNLVTILLQNPRIDINSKNPQCEDATPLHLAIMLGRFMFTKVETKLTLSGIYIIVITCNIVFLNVERTLYIVLICLKNKFCLCSPHQMPYFSVVWMGIKGVSFLVMVHKKN